MESSTFLGKVIGLYLIIASVAMLVNVPQFIGNVNGLLHDVPLMFVTGFLTVILGILMVVSHNHWQWHWRVIITVIAWLTMIKGATILLYPQIIDQLTALFVQNMNVAYVSAVISLVLGLILCYFGFKRCSVVNVS